MRRGNSMARRAITCKARASTTTSALIWSRPVPTVFASPRTARQRSGTRIRSCYRICLRERRSPTTAPFRERWRLVRPRMSTHSTPRLATVSISIIYQALGPSIGALSINTVRMSSIRDTVRPVHIRCRRRDSITYWWAGSITTLARPTTVSSW